MEDSNLDIEGLQLPKQEPVSKGILARFDHPIFGVFIGSWLVVNWKIVYWLLCGIKDPGATIEVIVNNYTNLSWSSFLNLFVIPFILTVGYLYYGPQFQEMYSNYKKRVALEKKKLSPVPRVELDKALLEAQIYRAAYNVINSKPIDWGRGSMQADQFVTNYSNMERVYFEYQKENAELKRTALENEKEIVRLKVELLNSSKSK